MTPIGTGLYRALLALLAAVASLEMALTLTSPEYRGEWNGRFDDLLYTWGHPVRVNLQGLREREIIMPKPTNTFRVIVLGDEATWGVGVAERERFTNLAERRLREVHPDRDIEVLNMGVPGVSLRELCEALLFWCEAPVEPDLIVVAFSEGPLRLFPNEDRQAHVAFAHKYPVIGIAVPRALEGLRLPRTARLWRRAVARLAEAFHAVPIPARRWPDARSPLLSPEDEQTLRDLRRFCEKRNLPPPIVTHLVFSAQAPADAWHINSLNGIHPRHFQAAWAKQLVEHIESALSPMSENAP